MTVLLDNTKAKPFIRKLIDAVSLSAILLLINGCQYIQMSENPIPVTADFQLTANKSQDNNLILPAND